jgi:hypothetical protein
VRGFWEYFEAIAGLSKEAAGGKLEQWMSNNGAFLVDESRVTCIDVIDRRRVVKTDRYAV